MKSKLITSCLEKIEYFDTVFRNTPKTKNKKMDNLINQTDIVKIYSKNGELHLILRDNNFKLSEIKMSMKPIILLIMQIIKAEHGTSERIRL